MRLKARVWIGLGALALGVVTTGICLAQAPAIPQSARDTISRPDDLYRWVTLGSTVHTDAGAAPSELRHVQTPAAAYEQFLSSGVFPDGAAFAVTFYALEEDASEGAHLQAGKRETFFGLEVLDRHHPDGRRFYAFVPGVREAQALPIGNACAACHNAHGAAQGLFVQHYPIADSVR